MSRVGSRRRIAIRLRPVRAGSLTVLICLCATLASCASHPHYGWTESEGIPQDGVDSAAMRASNMTVRKQIPTHEPSKIDFYFKHCELNSEAAFTSKTAYFCNDPF